MSRDTSRPDKLARQMFFVGLLGLPWLWIVNIFYFYDRVFGRLSCLGAASEDANHNNENNGSILGLISSDDGEEIEDGNDNNPSQQDIHFEMCKWVKRSTIGAFLSSTLLVTWVLVFQLNKESFGPKWFVYSSNDENLTGW